MSYTKYEPIEFENGILVSPAKVDLETGVITPPVYSGKKPIGATTLNRLEQGLVNLENYVINLVEDNLESNSTTNAPSIHAVNEALNGTILYENPTGATDNFELADDIKNYTGGYIEYKNNYGTCFTTQMPANPASMEIGLLTNYNSNNFVQFLSASIIFSGTTGTIKAGKYVNIYSDGTQAGSGEQLNSIYVTKVVGYK